MPSFPVPSNGLGVSYSIWFNRAHERSGHLFQGRFKSFLVEDDRYFLAMCFYIHGNPLRAGILKRLSDYRWSSYPAYANKRNQPPWLTTEWVLGLHGGSRKDFVEAQHAYFTAKRNPLDDLRHGLYLGSEEFSEECIERAQKEEHRERPQARLPLRDRDLPALARTILQRLGEKDPDSPLTPRRKGCVTRGVAIYILHRLGVYRNEEIGGIFGVGYTAITGAAKRGQAYVHSDRQAENRVSEIWNDI